MQADARQHAQLGARVVAVQVVGRIGFGEALGLGVGEDRVERDPLGLHPREHVVAGAVQDPGDALERVAGEALADGADHRDAAGDGGLEPEVDALLAGQAEQLAAFVRNQLLVRGHDRLLRGDGGAMVAAGRIEPADDLDDQVDVRAEQVLEALRPRDRRRHPVDALARDLAVADVGQRERGRRGEDQPGDGLADRAETEERDVHAVIIRARPDASRPYDRLAAGAGSRLRAGAGGLHGGPFGPRVGT